MTDPQSQEGGYPPPTLFGRRSRRLGVHSIVLLLALAVVLATCTASRFIGSDKKTQPHSEEPSADAIVDVPSPSPAPQAPENSVTPAPSVPAASADAPAEATPTAGDLRQANRWYYVRALGDGPGVIYSRTGSAWDYAFACALPARTIEFIAVNTGSPAGFDQQSMQVGATKLMMNASYARDSGGTISTKLPATNAFFDTLTNGATLEVQLLANRRVMLSIGPEVARMIRDCRGR